MSESPTTRPTLLVSGVAERRSADLRETALTKRLMQGVADVAGQDWHIEVTWGEDDGEAGALYKLEHADAVLVMGGPDISPHFYGGSAVYPFSGAHFPRSDQAQLALIGRAVHRGFPVLGICRGMQAINVALGGTLIQHIEAPGHTNPQLLEDYKFSRHEVVLDQASRLSQTLFGNTVKSAVSKRKATIHSAHHQAADKIGEGLKVVANGLDGVVEAIEHTSAPVYGVQWHPEDPDANPADFAPLLAGLWRHVGDGAPSSSTKNSLN